LNKDIEDEEYEGDGEGEDGENDYDGAENYEQGEEDEEEIDEEEKRRLYDMPSTRAIREALHSAEADAMWREVSRDLNDIMEEVRKDMNTKN